MPGAADADADAGDVVDAAVAGLLEHDDLVALLRSWRYLPREAVYPPQDRMRRGRDCLDAVDAAFFRYGVLTEGDYADILAAAADRGFE